MGITQLKISITLVFFVLIFISGYWLSAAKNPPAVVHTLHRILPFLTAFSTATVFYLLFRRK